jgi:hypothetical protein
LAHRHCPADRLRRFIGLAVHGDLIHSTLADQVGACAVALKPIHALIKAAVWPPNGCAPSTPLLVKGATASARLCLICALIDRWVVLLRRP